MLRNGIAKNLKGASMQTPKSIAFKIIGAQPDKNTRRSNIQKKDDSTSRILIPNKIEKNTREGKKAEVMPSISISLPNPDTICAGETVKYIITYADNDMDEIIDLKPSHIIMPLFKADVMIEDGRRNTKIIVLSNIEGQVGKNKYIEVMTNNDCLNIRAFEPFQLI